MTISISAARQVSVPARKSNLVARPSELTKAMDALEIGTGFDYVASGHDKNGNPQKSTLKNQYGNVAAAKWAGKEKTFKIFETEDQTGLGEFETRFTIARVAYEVPQTRAKRGSKPAAPAEGTADNGENASAE